MNQEITAPLFSQAWSVQKHGNDYEQNEDAWRIESSRHEESPRLFIAVSDGATEAVYSRAWARALVEAAAWDWPGLDNEALDHRLQQVRQGFLPIGPTEVVPWYVRTKFLTDGSQATLVVISVAASINSDFYDVQAVAIGDSCALLFKKSGEVWSFPIDASAGFGVNPSLIRNHHQSRLNYDRWEIQMQYGDLLLVCTDAVGKWALQLLEAKNPDLIFRALLELMEPEPEQTVASPEVPQSDTALPSEPNAEPQIPRFDAIAVEDDPVAGKAGENPSFLGNLKHWVQGIAHPQSSPDDSLNEGEKNEQGEQVIAEPATNEGAVAIVTLEPEPTPELDSTPESPQSPKPVPESEWKFWQSIERYRAPDAKPRMRNDDSTLIVCLPVRGTGEGQRQEVLEVIRNYQAAASERPLTIQQASPTPSDNNEVPLNNPTGDGSEPVKA